MPSAARVQWAKLRTAAVALVALSILGVLLYLLSSGTLFQEKAEIYLYIPDATGLGPGSPVRVNGIGVGNVTKVELSSINDPKRVVRITMDVNRRSLLGIPADSYAQISTDTLVGDKYVDITSGRSTAHLKPREEIAFKEQPDILKSVDIPQLEKTLRQVDEMLTGIEKGTSRVGQFVKGEKMYEDLNRRVGKLQNGLRQAASSTGKLGQFLSGEDALRRLRAPLLELDQTLARIQSGQGAGRFLRDSAQYEKLKNDVQSLRREVAEIQTNEFLTSERQYTAWNRTLDSLLRSLDEFNAGPMFAPSVTYDNLNGLARELAGSVRDFRENPKKYLRFKVF